MWPVPEPWFWTALLVVGELRIISFDEPVVVAVNAVKGFGCWPCDEKVIGDIWDVWLWLANWAVVKDVFEIAPVTVTAEL